jgi:protein O-mannosyl-transferase
VAFLFFHRCDLFVFYSLPAIFAPLNGKNTMAKQKPAKPGPAARPKPAAPKTPAPSANRLPMGQADLLFGLLAAALGFLLYANTFGYNYTLDDFSAIKENWVTKGGLKNLGIIFSTEYRFGAWNSPGSLYRPIPLAVFAFEWQLAPDKPGLGHFVNALFYGATGWVLWITWRRVLSGFPRILAALLVLFFIAHPVHTEVVANIKSLDEIFSLLFSTLALYGLWRHLEEKSNNWMVLALLAYLVAMFSKEGSITFLAIFPLTLWFFSQHKLSDIARVSAMMLIPAAFFLMVRYKVLSAQSYDEIYSPLDNFIVAAKNPAERYASAFMMCWEYLRVLLFPAQLVSDCGYPQFVPVGFGDWRALLGLFLYVAMGVWALIQLPKKHPLSYAILFYLISFSLYSNVLILIGTSYGERLLYIPSLGLALALAYGLTKLLKITDMDAIWNPNGKGSMVWGIAALILAPYALRTLTRNPAWKDSAALYAADTVQSPNCAKLTYHNALEEVRIGTDEKSGEVKDSTWVLKGIESYTKAIRLYPEYHDAFGSRGLAYFRMKKYDQAFEDYQTSLKHRPNDAKVLSNMGFIYFMRGQYDKAEEVYRKSIQFDPRFVDARRNLGAILAMRKDFDNAIVQWKEGLKYDVNNATLLFYIGSAYKDSGRPELAQEWLDKAYNINPALRK